MSISQPVEFASSANRDLTIYTSPNEFVMDVITNLTFILHVTTTTRSDLLPLSIMLTFMMLAQVLSFSSNRFLADTTSGNMTDSCFSSCEKSCFVPLWTLTGLPFGSAHVTELGLATTATCTTLV